MKHGVKYIDIYLSGVCLSERQMQLWKNKHGEEEKHDDENGERAKRKRKALELVKQIVLSSNPAKTTWRQMVA